MELNYTLNTHPRGYRLTFGEQLKLISGVCSPYAQRHRELAKIEASHRMGHKWVSRLESIPLLGAVAGVIERIVVYIFNQFAAHKTDSRIKKPVKKDSVSLKAINDEKIKTDIYKEWDAISNREDSPNIPVFHAGKHMRVFEHKNYPGFVLKLPPLKHAQDMLSSLEMCQKVQKKHRLNHCFIPATKVIPLNDAPKSAYDPESGYGLFIMQKANGIISPSEAREVSERNFEKFANDPKLKMKWKEYFRQAAEFICLTGYWDTSWSNIIIMEDGFGFVDFETVDPSKPNILCGITRLIEMAPPDFTDMIAGIAEKYHVDRPLIANYIQSKNMEEIKQKRKEELSLRSKVRHWHKKNGIKKGAQKCNENQWPAGSLERKIISKFNGSVDNNASMRYYKGCLIEQRKLHWQPFSHECDYADRSDFDAALKNLQEKGVISDWKAEENRFQSRLASYNIFF